MNLTVDSFIALAPILITSITALLVMISISVRRHHAWTAALTVVGLNLALLSILYSQQVIPQAVTPLLMVDGYALLYMAMILIATLGCATLCHAYMKGYAGNREERSQERRVGKECRSRRSADEYEETQNATQVTPN